VGEIQSEVFKNIPEHSELHIGKPILVTGVMIEEIIDVILSGDFIRRGCKIIP
jgi:hypothetical protein